MRANKVEIFNELSILLCSYIMTLFLNLAIPEDLKMNLGWAIIGIVSANIGTNISLVGYESFSEIIESRR